MIGVKLAGRDRIRAPESALGFVDLSDALAHDAQVVERVGKVRMRGPERPLLQLRRVAKMTGR